MEKLIDLLNKHRREKVKKQSGITEWHYNAFTFSLDNISGQQAELLIISKQYGFIKWLVENERIEGEKFQEPKIRGIIGLISNWHNSEGKSYKDYSKELAYESLLMLLSIQDEPIEFLVSILK